MEILLPSSKFRGAIAEDLYITLPIKRNNNLINEFDIVSFVDSQEQFNKERDVSFNYRITGNLDHLNFLSNKKKTWNTISDLFLTHDDDGIKLYDLFDVYLLYPYDLKPVNSSQDLFVKRYKKLTQLNSFNLLRNGYQQNIYQDEVYNYVFNKIPDLSVLDGFLISSGTQNYKLPITDLVLFYEFKDLTKNLTYKNFNNSNYSENNYKLSENTIYGFDESDINKTDSSYEYSKKVLLYQTLNISLKDTNNEKYLNRFLGKTEVDLIPITDKIYFTEIIDGELISFDQSTFTFTKIEDQEYSFDYNLEIPANGYDNETLERLIETKGNTNGNNTLRFKYNPFYTIKVRDYLSDYEVGNVVTTDNIASYALPYNSFGDLIWKDLLSNGNIEPDSNNGVDYPFLNGHHYINNIHKLVVKPDYNNELTKNILTDFFQKSGVINFNNNFNPNPSC